MGGTEPRLECKRLALALLNVSKECRLQAEAGGSYSIYPLLEPLYPTSATTKSKGRHHWGTNREFLQSSYSVDRVRRIRSLCFASCPTRKRSLPVVSVAAPK